MLLSPLFQIEKACQKLLGEAEDPAEFADALEEFMLKHALARLESLRPARKSNRRY